MLRRRKFCRQFQDQAIMYGIDVAPIRENDQTKDEMAATLSGMKKTEKQMREQDQRYLEIKHHANLQDLEEVEASGDVNFLNYLVIPLDADWKGYYDMIMLICACENTVMQAYYAAFGLPDDKFENILDMVIEGLFLVDLMFCMCQQYRDAET